MNFENIRLFLTDCDGVLTDGGMYYFEDGNEAKKFNTKDGMAFKLLREKGVKIGIITGEKTKIVENRANKLKMDFLYQGVTDKLSVIKSICSRENITLQQIVYVGDDINDIEALKSVGFSACPADANHKVVPCCKYVCRACGGQGVIREIVDMILK